jgi:alpha-galactosidase
VRIDLGKPAYTGHGVVAPDRRGTIYLFAVLTGSDIAFAGRMRFPGLDPRRRYPIRPLLIGASPEGLEPAPWWGRTSPG